MNQTGNAIFAAALLKKPKPKVSRQHRLVLSFLISATCLFAANIVGALIRRLLFGRD
jgi:hypothetical protein